MDAAARPLEDIYRDYLDCLNRQDWASIGAYVATKVRHNGRSFGLPGYRQMLEGDFRAIPDLHFRAGLIAVTPPVLAARLDFDCTPVGELFGLPVHGRRVRFAEHVFYRFAQGLIAEVWSIIDEAAIARQLAQAAENPGK